MSFPSPLHRKPIDTSVSEIHRRTLTDAELKRRRLNSPGKGILKSFHASSPFRDIDRNIHSNAFTSPIRPADDESVSRSWFDDTMDSTRDRKLGSRRVSFAPSAHVRLYQEANRQGSSDRERRSSDLHSKLMRVAMEENQSESAGSSLNSWDVDVSRYGSHDSTSRDSLSRSPLREKNSFLGSNDNFNELGGGNDDVTMEMTGNMAISSPSRHQPHQSPSKSPVWSTSHTAQSGHFDDNNDGETMELTGTIRSGGMASTHSGNTANFSPFRNAPVSDKFSPASNWPASHSTPQKLFSNQPGAFNRNSSPSPWGTSKRQSPSVHRYQSDTNMDDSLGSDFADRMASSHKRGADNILDEEIPALDDSFTAEDEMVSEKMSLNDFLTYAGISFMDNITPSTNVPNLTTLDKENAPPPTLADYVASHSSIIPELELYQYCCKELIGLIEDGRTSIKEKEEQMDKTTPKFILDYIEADMDMRELMDTRFKLIKQNARLCGKREWYIWRENLVTEINQVLRRNLAKLQEEQAKIDHSLMEVNKRLPGLISFLIDMRQTYIKATERAAALHTVDLEQIADLETEIEEQKISLETFKNDADMLKNEEADLNRQLEQLTLRKQQLNQDIDKAEQTCNEYKTLTLDDLRVAKKHYNEHVDIGRWDPLRISPDLMAFIYDKDLEIRIDCEKLKLRKEDATLVRLVPSESTTVTEMLLPGIKEILQNNWDTSVNVALYWRQVKIIQSELDMVQSRYSIVLDRLAHTSLGEGLQCTITLFNFSAKFKYTVSFPIRPEEVIDFPQVNSNDWTARKNYGDLSVDDMQSLIRKHIQSNGLLQLENTLDTIIQEAQLLIA
ncbi:hypothetical protein INT43_001730 [Umbelopsis isabellina]|uniref:Spc7 kinetochore protein domain-containing protein n=1 Tax=Mortierella isabellina TaxID=91625 RepID=A0A8H7UH08_MORIS|nr:hypothetical protein INT43_001730 [Umbelopsis isabellina]